jgi:large subunit ribosomal protein L22
MKSLVRQYRQSPRKVRLVADQVRGKSVPRAMLMLKMMNKRAATIILKAVAAAASNAEENDNKKVADLFVKEIRVDEGVTMKRYMPRAMGRASRINKRTSHIAVVLGEKMHGKGTSAAKEAEKPAEEKVEAKKKAPKAKKEKVAAK